MARKIIYEDENILASQRQLLRGHRVPVCHIGYDVGRKGMKDDEIIPRKQGRELGRRQKGGPPWSFDRACPERSRRAQDRA